MSSIVSGNSASEAPESPTIRRLLVLNTSYSLEMIRERGIEHTVTCRDLNGFFDHVWSVHPFATLVTSPQWSIKFGGPVTYELSPAHTLVEGCIGRFSLLERLGTMNFLIAQIGMALRLIQLVRKERINVIRADDPLYLGLLGWFVARLCKVPLVIRVGANHDKAFASTGQPVMPRLFRRRTVEKRVERFVLSRADLVAAANQDNLEFAISSGARLERSAIFRYGNLIDKAHFTEPSVRFGGSALLDELDLQPGRFLICIGRLEDIKLPDDTLRVLHELVGRGHEVKLALVGDGRMRPRLEALARELRIDDRLVFCGNRSQDWLAKVIPLAGVVLSPITGRALTEVALGAAAVVAYDIDWQKELIQHRLTGELVRYRSWMDMADGAERFLKDAGYARAMGHALRMRTLEMMDPETLDREEMRHYERLVSRA